MYRKREGGHMNSILIAVTSCGTAGDSGISTGTWLDDFATPYYYFKDNRFEVTVASPKGGVAPVDPKSLEPDALSKNVIRYYSDSIHALDNTVPLKRINPDDYDAVYYPGGHGCMYDLVHDRTNSTIIRRMSEGDKVIGAVNHGSAVLLSAIRPDGRSFVWGRKLTGTSNAEEAQSGMPRALPFLIQDRMVMNNAIYLHGLNGHPFVVRDGSLVTGQNPASSSKIARFMVKIIRRKWAANTEEIMSSDSPLATHY